MLSTDPILLFPSINEPIGLTFRLFILPVMYEYTGVIPIKNSFESSSRLSTSFTNLIQIKFSRSYKQSFGKAQLSIKWSEDVVNTQRYAGDFI